MSEQFAGTKLALFLGEEILVILRDDRPDISYPGHWDLPGGGREAGETPEACILRETAEEVSLMVPPAKLVRVDRYERPSGLCWFFAAHLNSAQVRHVRLGNEGQRWALMSAGAYSSHNRRIPHFADWVTAYLSATS